LFATIGGGAGNTSGEYGTVGGGYVNSSSGDFATVGGGTGNTNSGDSATVGGGANNESSGRFATVGGGASNVSSGDSATVGGGANNVSSGHFATVGGGEYNVSSGDSATVPGGWDNLAGGFNSFAAGQQAQALHDGAFVWADSQNAYYASTGSNQFCIRAQGGVQLDPSTSLFFGSNTRQMLNLWGAAYGIGVQAGTLFFRSDSTYGSSGDFCWFRGGVFSNTQYDPGSGGQEMMRLDHDGNLNVVRGTVTANSVVLTSDRNTKSNFMPVDAPAVLAKVCALPITAWNFKSEPAVRHLGPMAQDFYAAFGTGADDQHIAVVDEGGVALAAIQGLNQKLEAESKAKDAEIQRLREKADKVDSLEKQLNELREVVRSLAEKKSGSNGDNESALAR
jgi:hypothetical protein